MTNKIPTNKEPLSLEQRRLLAESFLTESGKRKWAPRVYRMARALIQTLDELEAETLVRRAENHDLEEMSP